MQYLSSMQLYIIPLANTNIIGLLYFCHLYYSPVVTLITYDGSVL